MYWILNIVCTQCRHLNPGLPVPASLALHKSRQTAVPRTSGKSPLFSSQYDLIKACSWRTVWSRSARQRCRCEGTLMHWQNDIVGLSATGKTGRQAPHGVLTLTGYLFLRGFAACRPLPYDCSWVLVDVCQCGIDWKDMREGFECSYVASS